MSGNEPPWDDYKAMRSKENIYNNMWYQEKMKGLHIRSCMLWIVAHGPKLCLVVIYIQHWNVVDSLQWNLESTSKLDFEGVNTLMGPNGARFDLIYHYGKVCEG